jgi:hypothetical protein
MAIEYKVSNDGLRIVTIPKGVLDAEQAFDYFDRLKNDKRIRPGATEIVYFSQVTDFKISFLETGSIAESFQEAKNKKLIDLAIFVCENDLAYGIGRMLKTLNEITNPMHKVIVVRSEDEIDNLINAV